MSCLDSRGAKLLATLLLLSFFSENCDGTKEKIVIDTQTNGLIAAFGDYDSDRFTDVFYLANGGSSLKLLKSHEKEPELREWLNDCTLNNTKHVITGVIPTDFNGDATMDVMLITQHHEHVTQGINRFNILIFKGDRTNLSCGNVSKTILFENDNYFISSLSHPLILDYNGDMISDFIIETEQCSRQLWMYSNKRFKSECLKSLLPTYKKSRMAFPNSNAFVNLPDGICQHNSNDYTTDIFISGESKMEYWIDRGGFSLENLILIQYPDRKQYSLLGQSTFIDLNIDGCTEHILPVCKQNGNSMCEPHIMWYSRGPENIWTTISDFRDESNQTNYYFDTIKTLYGFDLPVTVRPGDIDGDGFLDLITVMKSVKDGKSRAVILKNKPDELIPERRKFVLYWSSDRVLEESVDLASFLDVQENGKLDIILTTRNTQGQYSIKWIRNTFLETSCFLKVLVTSGLCHGALCPNEKVAYGTNQHGPFICYETSNVNGKPIKGCTTQLSQSGHFALQMPYSIFGLGETPNFVETVTASIPSGEIKPVRKSRWTQIVPDAQVVLIPYPPNETAYWISKLFYTPSSIVFSTLGTLAILCGLLIIIIFILHRKEAREDSAEHQEYKRHWPESR